MIRSIPIRAVLAGLLIGIHAACSAGGVGEGDSLVRKLDARIPEVVSLGNSPSVQVAVVHQGRLLWSRGFGENPSVELVYMNASVQKVSDATAVLQLAERGLIDLDADVGTYLPFELRHPGFPDTPITARMLLAHRSGLGAVPHQFGWDTRSAFSPDYRPPCPPELLEMSLGRFLAASLTPEGSNYDAQAWSLQPDRGYRYSVSAYPLLRYVIEQVAGQDYTHYMRDHLFAPLGMTGSGFEVEPFVERHAVPHVRMEDQNIELSVWNGNGYMLHTTAEDQARLMIALMDEGRLGDAQLLRPETVELMRRPTSRFKTLFKKGYGDLQKASHGIGLYDHRGGWVGYGGSAPGFQALWRFHPSRQVGYVILSNVNAILSGEYDSARADIYAVQNELLSILDPTLVFRRRAGELAFVGVILLGLLVAVGSLLRRKRNRSGGA